MDSEAIVNVVLAAAFTATWALLVVCMVKYITSK